MAGVCLIAYIARRRNGNSPDYFSVVGGILVKVDDGQKIWSHARVVARPDIESLGRQVSVGVEVLVGFLVAFAERRPSQSQGQQNQSAHQVRGIQFVIRLHNRSLSSFGHCGLSATGHRCARAVSSLETNALSKPPSCVLVIRITVLNAQPIPFMMIVIHLSQLFSVVRLSYMLHHILGDRSSHGPAIYTGRAEVNAGVNSRHPSLLDPCTELTLSPT